MLVVLLHVWDGPFLVLVQKILRENRNKELKIFLFKLRLGLYWIGVSLFLVSASLIENEINIVSLCTCCVCLCLCLWRRYPLLKQSTDRRTDTQDACRSGKNYNLIRRKDLITQLLVKSTDRKKPTYKTV